MNRETELEFFRLAAVWLLCRQACFRANNNRDRMWHFLGEMDYATEMALLLREQWALQKQHSPVR